MSAPNYAALLVERDYALSRVADSVPVKGGPVIAVVTVAGTPSTLSRRMTPAKTKISGFEREALCNRALSKPEHGDTC